MDLTFQEKSLWASLITTIVLFSVYFILAFQIILDPEIGDLPQRFSIGALFTIAIIVFVIIEAVVHILLAIIERPEKEDERARYISLKATRNGAVVLAIGVWLCFAALAFTTIAPMFIAHLLLSSFIIAEIIRFSSQLIYFRLSA